MTSVTSSIPTQSYYRNLVTPPPPPSSLGDIFRKSGKDIAENGATLVIDSNWPLTGCGDESNSQDVNFGSMSVDECVGTFLVAMDSCGDFTNPNGDKFWKYGGQNRAKCAFWTVREE